MMSFLKNIRFEYKITLVYLLIGGTWILFSDKLLLLFVTDVDSLSTLQTYKGWFYMLTTAFILYSFLRTYLKKLRIAKYRLINQQDRMELLIKEKTQKLDQAVRDLSQKNDLISSQNDKLKKALKDLKMAQVQLVQVEKIASLGVLSAGLAHEINNPLNYILWGVDGLQDSPLNASLYIKSIREGIHRITKIVQSFNRLDNTAETSFSQITDLSEIIEKSLLLIEFNEQNVLVRKNFEEQSYCLECNVGQLQYVFVNLFQNALDAFEEKGVIDITCSVMHEHLVVVFEDNGCGIANANIPRITDPFFTTKSPGKGLGLGLSIALNIINNHNGSLHFDSKVDKGTRVTVKLPLLNV